MPKRLDLTRRPAEPQGLLDRILSTPHLARIVPQLQPEVIHRVIQRCGLEDSSEFVALATPEQLERVFDLDLWRAGRPGHDERFDADRFGVWLEVLVEAGADVAARKLAEMDAGIVTAGFAQHVRVFDRAAVSRYTTTDGIEVAEAVNRTDGLTCEVGGYLAVARRTDSWEAIVAVLTALARDHHHSFEQVMSGCRALSNSRPEIDGLDDLLEAGGQAMFDVALDREQRRDESGFVAPAQARAFLEASRRLRFNRDTAPSLDPIAQAHLRATDSSTVQHAPEQPPERIDAPRASEDHAESLAAIVEVLRDAGIFAPQPRALLTAADTHTSRLQHIQARMQFVLQRDEVVASQRNDELAFLANSIAAGSSVQGRPLSTEEAWDAATAVCNLGLENWPPRWLTARERSVVTLAGTAFPDDFLLATISSRSFKWDGRSFTTTSSWTSQSSCSMSSPHSVAMTQRFRAASRVAYQADETLASRSTVARCRRAGRHHDRSTCRRGRRSLDCSTNAPSCMRASAQGGSGTHAVSATDFEFISENSQIASINEFLRLLPETLHL